MFAHELSQHVPADQVIINVCNPGACKGTQFGAETRGIIESAAFWALSSIMVRSVIMGARQYVDSVTVRDAASHGSFVSDGMIKP